MNIYSYIPKTFDEAFGRFKFKPFDSQIKHVRLLAYEGTVSDELMFVYEIYGYENTVPRFYGTSHYDHSDGETDRTTEIMKTWSKSSKITLIETDNLNYLFELIEPFGIVFSQLDIS
jgi:hypothetical protein